MMKLVIHGTSMEEVAIGLDDFNASLDLMPLARDIETFLVADNQAARELGLDAEDKPLERLKQITIDTRQGDPFAEPFVPHGDLSRVVFDFATDVTELGQDAVAITGAWPNTPFLSIHADGYTSRGGNPVPPRDIIGIRPSARIVIERMMYDWAASKIKG